MRCIVKPVQMTTTFHMNVTRTVKRIVCLANSRKRGGRCVAGKELLADGRAGGWIRPVSAARKRGSVGTGTLLR